MNKYIVCGSRAFFNGIDGFVPNDNDVLTFVDSTDVNYKFIKQAVKDDEDVFEIVYRPKIELINNFIKFGGPSSICTFLLPEVVELLNLNIEDLHILKPLRDQLNGSKHEYLGLIYDSYIENNAFTLTDEQLQNAYKSYVETRKARQEKRAALEKRLKKAVSNNTDSNNK